jgi:hypothetical protein
MKPSSNDGVKKTSNSVDRQTNFMLPSLTKAEEILIKTNANYHPLPLAQLTEYV